MQIHRWTNLCPIVLLAIALVSGRSAEARTLPTSAVATISVTPADASIVATTNLRYTATATFQSGSPRVLSSVPIAAGARHTCALLTEGTVECWGGNSSGQLGNATEIDSPTPKPVSGLASVTAIAAGEAHSCALLGEGTIACWGDNFRGQLGDGSNGRSSTPVPVDGITTATAIAAGAEHTCALLADGSVRCWGWNFAGQLGDATNQDSNTPVPVGGISGATTLAAGGEHTCALLVTGRLRCWGRNFFGQLGDGSNDASNAPVAVDGLESVATVSAGDEHTCAVLADGAARCWGQNSLGRLGNGIPGNSNVPVSVSGISTARAVAAGDQHTCAALADGTVQCWGSNARGQIGNGSLAGGVFDTPIDVGGIASTTAISAGSDHVCALSAAGALRCWGANGDGQLGTGSSTGPEVCAIASACSPTPVFAAGIGVAMVSSSGSHACAAFTDGTVSCWGDNSFGQLGAGAPNPALEPVSVSGVTTATAVAAGQGHSCALLADGHVNCWGSNIVGQLGVGTTVDSSAPVEVNGIDTATAISAGAFKTCAVLASGAALCWGRNSAGELGNGSATGPLLCGAEGQQVGCATAPEPVFGISTARAISAGGQQHVCALLAGGTVSCWGANTRGQLGNANQDMCNNSFPCSATPLPVSGIVTASTISAGGQHTCATLDDGTARCWGSNDNGQLGNTATGTLLPTPLVVTGFTAATAISAGAQHTCGNAADGSVSCWGGNSLGQLGNGTTGPDVSTPGLLSSISTAIAVSAGTHSSCAVVPDGTVACWGFNSVGQLGDGTTALASTPVMVSHIFDAVAAVSWSSLDPSAASIGSDGVASGIAPGMTVISAAAINFDASGGTTLAVPEPGFALGMAIAAATLARLATRARRAVDTAG